MSIARYNVNGTPELVAEGVRALEGIRVLIDGMDHDPQLAEFYVFENMPIKAIVCDDLGCTEYVWKFGSWEPAG